MKTIFVILALLFSTQLCSTTMKLNTSNKGKYEEFKRLFAQHNVTLESTHIDLKEIDADPLTVAAHKASQLDEGVIIEDTSLEIEGASVGVNIRWLLDHLSNYVGHKALWTVLLAYRTGDQVNIYKGTVSGTIVHPQGEGGFGFDAYFLPDGANKTLAQSKPDPFNARAKAVDALICNAPAATLPVIKEWNGPWQHD